MGLPMWLQPPPSQRIAGDILVRRLNQKTAVRPVA